jgi:hypothetical protein
MKHLNLVGSDKVGVEGSTLKGVGISKIGVGFRIRDFL